MKFLLIFKGKVSAITGTMEFVEIEVLVANGLTVHEKFREQIFQKKNIFNDVTRIFIRTKNLKKDLAVMRIRTSDHRHIKLVLG